MEQIMNISAIIIIIKKMKTAAFLVKVGRAKTEQKNNDALPSQITTITNFTDDSYQLISEKLAIYQQSE